MTATSTPHGEYLRLQTKFKHLSTTAADGALALFALGSKIITSMTGVVVRPSSQDSPNEKPDSNGSRAQSNFVTRG